MQFTDFKVRTWPMFAFGALIVPMLVSSGLALRYLANAEANLETVVQDNNVRIRIGNELSESVHIVSHGMASIVLQDDRAEKEREVL